MTVAVSSQELVQKDPGGESEAVWQPEEAALSGLTGDSTSPDLCELEFLVFEYKPRTTETPVYAANTIVQSIFWNSNDCIHYHALARR